MTKKDPLQKIEHIIKHVNDGASKYTEPVFSKYPLIFAFLIIFGVSAIMHGFNALVVEIEFFHEHPGILLGIGVVVLVLTGRLYKWLEKSSHSH